ncbi:MAG: protein-L-isoaspartate(D-aspartate) O-methyltransferase [Solirubrobacteraceae bacterium]
MGLYDGDGGQQQRPGARRGPLDELASDYLSEATKLALRLAPAIGDVRVLAAIASIPRERFVDSSLRDRAYANVALPIACDQTISQPLVVARMLELLELAPTDRVLDVGTGSGYHAALLALLAAEVYTIERHPDLTSAAEHTIRELGLDNVHFAVGDGWQGLPEHAPFQAINVAAATGPAPPPLLVEQLAPGGRLVAPVGRASQHLTLVRRTESRITQATLEGVRFVPLVRGERGGK